MAFDPDPFCYDVGYFVLHFPACIRVPHVQVDVLVAATSLTLFFGFILLVTMQGFKAVDIYEDQLKVKWRFSARVVKIRKILKLFQKLPAKQI